MAQRTVAHMYDRYEDAQMVVNDLEAAGIPHSDISLVANAATRGQSSSATTGTATTGTDAPASTGGGTGAVLGTMLGGGAGLLAGLGSLAIPGVGPVVAAGWLVATLTGAGIGAAGGGLVGSLTGAGVSKDDADVYAEGVRGGGSLVTVRVDDADATRIQDVMNRRAPVDLQQRRASYGADWTGFNPDRSPDSRIASGPDVPAAGAPGSFAPGTDPGRRL